MNLKRKMLSILPAFTIVLAILLLTPITVKAANYAGDCGNSGAVKYLFDPETKKLTIYGNGEMSRTATSRPWEDYSDQIETVVIENGVTGIGNYAFYGCSSLTSITIPSGVTYIGYYAFYACGLTSITIPSGVTGIHQNVFAFCSKLKSVTIPNSVTSIEEQAFYGCSSLASITIPNSVTSIEEKAFGKSVEEFVIYGVSKSAAHVYAVNNGIKFVDANSTNVSDASATFENQTYIYNGSAFTPEPTVYIGDKKLTKDTDYTIYAYTNNINAGTATVIIKGKGTYTGTKSITFTIGPRSMDDVTVQIITFIYSPHTYTGSALTPEPTVYIGDKYLTKDKDYTVKYTDNINAGTATVTVNGINNFTGWKSTTFTIQPASISSATVTLPDQTYTGSAQTPEPTVYIGNKKLTKDTDYTLNYSDNIDAGTATVTITGKGNCQGTVSKNYTINKADISTAEVTLLNQTYIYNGSAFTPEPTVKIGDSTLTKDKDYTVSYSNNTNAGTGTVTITGKGSCTGTKDITFVINPASISSATVTLPDQTYIYNGSAFTPEPTVKIEDKTLTSDTDYTVSYSNNTNAGTATVTITGKGSCAGTKDITFVINPASISSATVTLPDQTYIYNGSAFTPEPTVKIEDKTLTSDTDYTVSYSDNTNAGTATITITGKGNYTGTVSQTFSIKPVYTITVTSDGNGTASANPESGAEGTEVTLTATPNAGYQFREWLVVSGNVTVNDNKFIIGTADVHVLAIFEKDSSASYTITFDAGEGTGIMPSVDKGAGSYTLPANGFTAPAGKEFKAWLVDGEEKNPGVNIAVNENKTITAIWTEHVHTYGAATYTWAGDNSKVTAKKICESDSSHVETETVDTTSEITTAATCTEKGKTTYKATFENEGFTEQTKTVENVEALGHDWGEWQVTTPATETAEGVETRTCKNESSHTETRKVAKTGVTSYTITVNSGLGGSANASAGTAEIGEAVTITATPYAGYELDTITYIPEGGSETDITETKTFTMPEAAVTVNVTFKKNDATTPDPATYKVTFVTNGGTEVGEQIVQADDKAAKPADPQKEGYTFAGWYTDEALTEEYDFNTLVTADVIVYAKWIEAPETPATYTVTVSGDENGTASADPESGETETVVTLTAAPNEGYRFKEWQVVSGDVTITNNKFTIGNENVEVKAIFEKIPKATKPDDTTEPDTTPSTGDVTPPSEGEPIQTPSNGGTNSQTSSTGGTDNQTSSNDGATTQAPAPSATEVKIGDTVNDDKSKASFVITSTETNKETVTYVSATNNTASTLTVPDTVTISGKKYKVTEIKANAFKNNKKLKKITIGKNVEKIGKNAFSGCKNLKNVNIKTTKLTKKTVGANAFKGINAKAKVKVPKSKLKDYKTILKARGIKGKNQKIK